MELHDVRRRLLSRTLVTVVGFTIVLTAGFVGLAAIVKGDTSGVSGRISYYVLTVAVGFLVSLWKLDDPDRDGVTVLVAAGGIGASAGTLIALAVEGIVYAIAEPGTVMGSDLLVYFLAAAIICTGLGIWGLRHWREFANGQPVE